VAAQSRTGHPHGGAPTGYFMDRFNPEIHHRRSIRLKGYDYSQQGSYFITVCTHHRELLLESSPVQDMLRSFWGKLSNKFPMVQSDEFVIMPNHIHGIIMITVGATPRGCPNLGGIVDWYKTMTTNAYIKGVKKNQWAGFNGRLWQRNYYEHVIRDEEDLNRIRQYIIDNPIKWDEDEENPKNWRHGPQI
jgi:REP element-mobilizing transposase RayT